MWKSKVTWTRKPNRIDEVTGRVKRADLPELMFFYPHELWRFWPCPSHDLMDPFSIPVPQYFLMRIEGHSYLVNTEGYNYCRYVAKVEED